MVCFLATLFLIANGQLAAQEADLQTILTGLNQPCGVAIHPADQQVYLADSGNGKVLRVVDGVPEDLITGFPVDRLSPDFGFVAGPLGVAFLDEGHLIVTTGGWDVDRVILVDLTQVPQTADQALAFATLPASDDLPAEGDFFGVCVQGERAWVTGRADPQSGWVSQWTVGEGLTAGKGQPATLERRLNTWQATATRLPTAITASPDGFLVVGQRGEPGMPSTLAFYDPVQNDLRAKFVLDREGLIALAYGPRSGRLFALFHSLQSPETNGLYKLVARKRNTACEARLLQKLPNPLSMAFSDAGELFVTLGGEQGSLVKLTGLDLPPEPTTDPPR